MNCKKILSSVLTALMITSSISPLPVSYAAKETGSKPEPYAVGDDGTDTSEKLKINFHDYAGDDSYTSPFDIIKNKPINAGRPYTFQFSGDDFRVYPGKGVDIDGYGGSRWWNNYAENHALNAPRKYQKGIYDNVLHNGYPALSRDTGNYGYSLDYLFDPNSSAAGVTKHYTGVNKLFKQDNFTKKYTLDSSEDFMLLQPDGTIKHNTTVGPSYDMFVPLDQIAGYDGNLRNMWFGMDITGKFQIPDGGLINGRDMIFEFSGDDDMLVYIDDVLVLDLGGIHTRVPGKINFTTGQVEEGWVTNFDQKEERGTLYHTIADSFAAAGKTWDGSAGSTHTIKIFYLERGYGDSNCKISMNLPFKNLPPEPIGNYKVSYNANGGSGSMTSDIVRYNTNYTAKQNGFSNAGYEFAGWNTDPNGYGESWTPGVPKLFTHKNNITLYAQWKKSDTGSYTVRYNRNGGFGSMSDSIFKINEYGYLRKNQFTRSGYKFLGWSTNQYDARPTYYDESQIYNLTTIKGGTVDLYAIWESTGPSSFTVTYKPNGAYGSDQIQSISAGSGWYTKGEIFSRSGYVLESWNTDPYGNGLRYSLETYQNPLTKDLTLYAQWTQIDTGSYTVRYNRNGGSGSMSDSIFKINEYGYLRKNQFTRKGYKFLGWSTNQYDARPTYYDESQIYNLTTIKGGIVDLYAIWEQETTSGGQYTVVYLGNGADGGSTESSIHTIGVSRYLSTNGYYKNGHVFAGWSYSSNGNVAYRDGAYVGDLSTTPGDKVYLYAQWTKVDNGSYTVRYNSNGGSGYMANSTHKIDEYSYLSQNEFTRSGYKFLGWSTNKSDVRPTYYDQSRIYNLTTINGGIVDLYAIWEYNGPSSYTVTYKANGGNGSDQVQTVPVGQSWYTKDTIFSRNGYALESWNTNQYGTGDRYGLDIYQDPLTSNLTLYAQWTKVDNGSYTVRYNSNGGSGYMANSTHKIDEYSYLSQNEFTRSGYKFLGWSTNKSDVRPTYYDQSRIYNLTTINGGIVDLYAIWEYNGPSSYTVTYKANGGSGNDQTQEVAVGQSWYSKGTIFSRNSYVLESWNTDKNGYGTRYELDDYQNPLTDNLTLYAQWKYKPAGQYTVVYLGNGATSGSTESSVHTIGSWKYLSYNGYERKNYAFKGWSKQSTGQVDYIDHEYVGDLSTTPNDVVYLYAVWEYNGPSSYTVTYKANGGTGSDQTQEVPIKKNWYTKGNIFTKEGYELESWNTSVSGDGTRYELNQMQSPIEQNLTLYAQYKPYRYTVNYHGNGATSGSTVSSIHEFDKPKNLTPNGFHRDGYIFEGWTTIPSKGSPYQENNLGTYALKNFYQDREEVVNLTNINNDVIDMYAVWKVVEHTVTYKPNGGNGVEQVQKVRQNNGWYVKDAIFSKKWHTLESWNTEPNGTGKRYELNSYQTFLNKDLVLYAQWKITTPPTITIGDSSKTFYEGTTVTREDLLKNISASDVIEGDITGKLKIIKIEYAAGRNGTEASYIQEWENGMLPTDRLDTWFMELPKDLSPVKHIVTFQVTADSGLSATAIQEVYVKYNEFPTIVAEDRYFTLEEAQSGKITDKVLREDAIRNGTVSAQDTEEGNFSNQDKITLLDFDPEEFEAFTDSGYRRITYHVQDTYGPNGKGKETVKQIIVYVVKDGEIPSVETEKRVRFISQKYYDKNKDLDPERLTPDEIEHYNANGGLNVNSKWYRDDEYRTLIENTFMKTSGKTYRFTLEQVNRIREYVEVHGIGNAKEANALEEFAKEFMK